MIYKKNSQPFLTVLVLALIVPGLAVLAGSQKTQALAAAETAGTYAIDPLHTNVGFRVRHMGLAIVLEAVRPLSTSTGWITASSGVSCWITAR